MKKESVIIIVVLLMVLVAVIFFSLSKSQGNSTTLNNVDNSNARNQNTQNSNQNSGNEESQPTSYSIDISGFAFNPDTLIIKAGDSVIWTNKDSVKHTITSDSTSELDSSLLSKSQTYSYTFNTPGEFNYHCTPHPYMKGKIIVQ